MITLEQVQAQAASVVERFGTLHKNPGEYGPERDGDTCLYTNINDDHCIAGQVLTELGVGIPVYGGDGNKITVDAYSGFKEAVEPDALDWLYRVQSFADGGHTWANAVKLTAQPESDAWWP